MVPMFIYTILVINPKSNYKELNTHWEPRMQWTFLLNSTMRCRVVVPVFLGAISRNVLLHLIIWQNFGQPSHALANPLLKMHRIGHLIICPTDPPCVLIQNVR